MLPHCLVENGTLKTGDLVVSGQHYGRVKAMFNERNKKEDVAGPSAPAVILGLNGARRLVKNSKYMKMKRKQKKLPIVVHRY